MKHKTLPHLKVRERFLYAENPTLGVGFNNAYSYTTEQKTPFGVE